MAFSSRKIIQNTTIPKLSSDTEYKNCNILNIDDIYNVVFDNCKFKFTNPFSSKKINKVEFKNNCTFDTAEFQQCEFIESILFGIPNLKITKSQISKCNFSNSIFTSLDLTGSFLTNCDFTYSNLSNAILTDVCARNNINFNLKLPSAWKVVSSHWIGPQANLSNIVLQNVSLNQMNLYATNLTNATLQNVSIQDTIFLNAIF